MLYSSRGRSPSLTGITGLTGATALRALRVLRLYGFTGLTGQSSFEKVSELTGPRGGPAIRLKVPFIKKS